jgi:hypothetical protein
MREEKKRRRRGSSMEFVVCTKRKTSMQKKLCWTKMASNDFKFENFNTIISFYNLFHDGEKSFP